MGGNTSKLSGMYEEGLEGLDDAVHTDLQKLKYKVETRFTKTSGRLTRSYKLSRRATTNHIVKAGWCIQGDEKTTTTNNNANTTASNSEWKETQLSQLQRLTDLQCVAPLVCWLGETTRTVSNNQILRPVFLLRPYYYTTLADRLSSRPFLKNAEKLWLVRQLLCAVEELHAAGVCHGSLSTENIGLTSLGKLVLLDVSFYKTTYLSENDPTKYQLHFGMQSENTAKLEKRCYLAPERFITSVSPTHDALDPAMDIFAVGCVLTELFLNGERCMDLGDLMEYKANHGTSEFLTQKLSKIELPEIRVIIKHMMQLTGRWDAKTYLAKLQDVFPPLPVCQLCERLHTSRTDLRVVELTKSYKTVLWECLGVDTQSDFRTVLGSAVSGIRDIAATVSQPTEDDDEQVQHEDLWARVDALLLDLDRPVSDSPEPMLPTVSLRASEERSEIQQQSVVIYLQFVLSTIRHAQRPVSKLVGLQLIQRLSEYCSDEARLQRIVPVVISLFQDSDTLVRSYAVQVLTDTISRVESFPPSDAQVFSQYIWKNVGPLISDHSLMVRISFCKNMARLAETARKFLDVSHAVRLFEAVGTSGSASREGNEADSPAVFGDDVAKLLDTESKTSSDNAALKCRTLVPNTYAKDLAALHEIVSRWVVQITTDQSEHASFPKRAILSDLSRLCSFFGLDGVMSFLLPQILAFLNERKDWELRVALFEHLPAVCQTIGRGSTEKFVLPCLEIGLVDGEEVVVCGSLACLARLVTMGLLSRTALVGNSSSQESHGLLKTCGALLLHPSDDVRQQAFETVATIGQAIGPPDMEVHATPVLRPFMRFHPSAACLSTTEGIRRCSRTPWKRDRWDKTLEDLLTSERNRSAGTWMSVGLVSEEGDLNGASKSENESTSSQGRQGDIEDAEIRSYLRMLARHTTQSSPSERFSSDKSSVTHGIEGSVKLAQSIMFPRQDCSGYQTAVLPSWYSMLRETASLDPSAVTEAASIRSVSTLGHVYGLSIMGPLEGTAESSIVGAADDSQASDEDTHDVLKSEEAREIEAAFLGQWGAESSLDPEIVDTSLLLTKIRGLSVPPLPDRFGDAYATPPSREPSPRGPLVSPDWKPRIKALFASSSPVTEHTASVSRLAVSLDQRFFVSGSHDGTCRVWETSKMEQSAGLLDSSFVYNGHNSSSPARVNDVAMIEGTHSIVSGDSLGAVHVWRVDMVASSGTSQIESGRSFDRHRVVGTSTIRTSNPAEGEILAVSHFNSPSSSVITFATQKGVVHSWDLRGAREPFKLTHSPDLGHLTSMALGSDRNWVATGTSRGVIALWDIRYQQCLKMWQHSQESPITRLATSMVSPPQSWGATGIGGRHTVQPLRPFIFAAAGTNECAMFDVVDGTCKECFRTIYGESRNLNSHVDALPSIVEIALAPRGQNEMAKPQKVSPIQTSAKVPASTINCMVGSIGAGHNSYLVTGGNDGKMRFWDFATPSKCYVVGESRPSFERFDFDGQRRLMLCRQSQQQGARFPGLKKPDHNHTDSIEDVKVFDNKSLISCSRDCTVKVWR